MTWEKLLPLLWTSTQETLYMTFWSSLIAYVIGLPLGVLLVVTRYRITYNAILKLQPKNIQKLTKKFFVRNITKGIALSHNQKI